LLASLLLAACGVPISAADLTLTPEATPETVDVTLFSQGAVSSQTGTSVQADPASRSLTALSALTPQPSLTPLASLTAGPSRTPTLTPVPSTPTPQGTPAPTTTPPAISGDLAMQALAIVNKYRTDSGRAPLQVDAALMASAASYARVMAENSWFRSGDPHTGPDGSQPEHRIARAGYGGRFGGETLTAGQGAASDAVYAWMISPAHAAIILSNAAVDVGIGHYYNPNDIYGHYWVLITGVR
jgi:uncharacterized protein YkwD